ncbi:MAG: type III-B CRISPR module RAMP protein Cmr1 [Deltaproteobacteria bacterium]|nr:type III-B CRISPR module RAMP protein Cmr1 [Deltaproteobacteria bacterium]
MIITRFHNMERLQLTVEFLTPTFLGGADQNAELRAAPFKNLLRQWWRVVVGSRYDDPAKMLAAEGELFGSVLGDSKASAKASASQVRLTMTQEKGFSFSKELPKFEKTWHPEVKDKKTGKNGRNVNNELYLGFGPITLQTIRKYIAPGSKATLTVTFPKAYEETLRSTLDYIDAFGAIGSRCRNGWGSLALSGKEFQRQEPTAFAADDISRIFNTDKRYPFTLGKDSKGILCWENNTHPQTWDKAINLLAATYMTLRTSINIAQQGLQKRHIMGYPVTNHSIDDWESKEKNGRIRRDGRMPSQLRLMVKRDRNDQLLARILHLPHKLPKQWTLHQTELDVWREIHRWLDDPSNKNNTFHRCGGAQ